MTTTSTVVSVLDRAPGQLNLLCCQSIEKLDIWKFLSAVLVMIAAGTIALAFLSFLTFHFVYFHFVYFHLFLSSLLLKRSESASMMSFNVRTSFELNGSMETSSPGLVRKHMGTLI